MFGFVKVKGSSMSPEYISGDFLFFIRGFKKFFIKSGKNVLVRHPEYGLIVKKIKHVNYNNQTLKVKGNNSSSTRSEEIGVVHFRDIMGFPIFKFS